jgi:RNA polymerase sigma factor (sigma-70 family)
LTDKLNDIISGCINGNRQSQEELYKLLSPKMFAVCRQYASDESEACDFMQEGFVSMFMKITSYRGDGSFEGWVRKIMVNTALQSIRKKNRLYLLNEEITEDADYETPDVLNEIDAEHILEMIRKLPVNQRMVFNLFAIEGYNHAEIANMTGMTENTSKSHLHRARIALKGMIENRLPSASQQIRKNV